jgi:hypothetical protein
MPMELEADNNHETDAKYTVHSLHCSYKYSDILVIRAGTTLNFGGVHVNGHSGTRCESTLGVHHRRRALAHDHWQVHAEPAIETDKVTRSLQ